MGEGFLLGGSIAWSVFAFEELTGDSAPDSAVVWCNGCGRGLTFRFGPAFASNKDDIFLSTLFDKV
jgi:hypothetical protein